jgi:hypothetical protein
VYTLRFGAAKAHHQAPFLSSLLSHRHDLAPRAPSRATGASCHTRGTSPSSSYTAAWPGGELSGLHNETVLRAGRGESVFLRCMARRFIADRAGGTIPHSESSESRACDRFDASGLKRCRKRSKEVESPQCEQRRFVVIPLPPQSCSANIAIIVPQLRVGALCGKCCKHCAMHRLSLPHQ